MMKALRITLISAFLIAFLYSPAQNVSFKKKNFPKDQHKHLKIAVSRIKDGDAFYKEGLYATYQHALLFYRLAHKFNPSNAQLNFKIGMCYLKTTGQESALPYLQAAYELDKDVDPQILLYLAESYHYALQTDRAEELYRAYLAGLQKKKHKAKIAYVNKQLEACQHANFLIKKPIRVVIDNVGAGVNTKWPEHTPLVTADDRVLVFSASRDNNAGKKRSQSDLMYNEDVYLSTMENGQWMKATNIGSPVNSREKDIAVGLSHDGKQLIIYRERRGGDLFLSTLKGDSWSKPVAFPRQINSKARESSATFSPDGNTLYFTSNRKKGFGGSDIYYTQRNDNGKWGKAVNMGSVLNTPSDEQGVFLHPNGKRMYFSSNGHPGMGGFDLFTTTWNDSIWTSPVNIGYPINTPADEFTIVVTANQRHGYFSSGRSGGKGDKDIYKVTFLGPEKQLIHDVEDNLLASRNLSFRQRFEEPDVAVEENLLTLFHGKILDAKTLLPVEAKIEITDNETARLLFSSSSNSLSGHFLVPLPSGKKYGIAVTSDKYLFFSIHKNIPEETNFQDINQNILLSKLEVGAEVELRNVFLEEDGSSLQLESVAELDRLVRLMRSSKKLRIEISDYKGGQLSQEAVQPRIGDMAKAIANYLIVSGIDPMRIVISEPGNIGTSDVLTTEEAQSYGMGVRIKILSL